MTSKFPSIKSAGQIAYLCGLQNMEEAILNWDRGLMHGPYTEIPNKSRMMSIEIEEGIQKVNGDSEFFFYMTLQSANEVLSLGIDFEEESHRYTRV